MAHRIDGRKLSRKMGPRLALYRNLTVSVLRFERIKTTEAKAKAVKPEIEKLITLAKRGDLHARRQALSELGQDKFTVYKLFEEIAPRYAQRAGGYTRILKLGPRRGDAAEAAILEFVDYRFEAKEKGPRKESLSDRARRMSGGRVETALEGVGEGELPENLAEYLNKSVDELELSVRSANCLKNAGIRTIRDLVQKSEKDMLETKNFGRKSLNEIRDILRPMGL